jgi:2-oxoglutarate dehydrogenase E1 component
MELMPNPSHLEVVAPVAVGKARAIQFHRGDTEDSKKQVMPIILHGDAAFAGQGVVYETFQLMNVEDFAVGGTIHIVVNNQVGFTTDPWRSRSTKYCSDVAKGFNAPIFHVNGDDVLAVNYAFEVASEFRQTYGKDVVIDLVCYRRFGHNEGDNPEFTQPVMYKKVAKHPEVDQIMGDSLVANGWLAADQVTQIKTFVADAFDKSWEDAHSWNPLTDGLKAAPMLTRGQHSVASPIQMDVKESAWEAFKSPNTPSSYKPTGMDLADLNYIGGKLTAVPEGLQFHRQITRVLKSKQEMFATGQGIDWGTAEALAFGSLLQEGIHIRLTGQDVQRGTFSHRHCLVHDQPTGKEHTFLNHLQPQVKMSMDHSELLAPDTQAKFTVRNSILSELALLGFEYGYSLQSPYQLCIWEAQFGDFSNAAQMMLDQFISTGEHKWLTQSGLVMLLPHGYDGQGSEHSSCRLERYLQLLDDDEDDVFDKDKSGDISDEEIRLQVKYTNWCVMNLTTAANYFHALRSQVHRDFRKPLVVAAPKLLLRSKDATSPLTDFGPESSFQRLIPERDEKITANADKVKRLVFCSGKVYYALVEEREKRGLDDVAIVTVEQLAPFPYDLVAQQMKLYTNVNFGDGVYPGDVVWCQEEPKNMGPWPYTRARLVSTARELCNKDVVFKYAGRRSAASPATGIGSVHTLEQAKLMEEALVA